MNRSTRPTWLMTPAAVTVSTISSTNGADTAKGFSQNTALPAAAALATSRGCSLVQVVT